MKKLLIVMVVALLALALVACGGEEATTTKGDDAVTTPAVTTPKATEPTTTTPKAPVTTTVAPETTKAPETTPEVTTPVVTTPAVTTPATTTPATSSEPSTPGTPEVEAIDLIAAGAGSIAIEDHHASHDNNLVLAFSLPAGNAWNTLFGAGTPASENGNWNLNEGYTIEVMVNGTLVANNRFSYYGFKTDDVVTNGYFRFELGAFDDLTTNGVSCTLEVTFTLKNANGNALVTGDFGTLKYGTLVYEADTDNPGKDALVVTPVSGPDFNGGEGTPKMFDNKTTTKLCTDDRTPVIFTVGEAKALGGLSILTANDNQTYTGRIVSGFTLYGANSADATEWTTVLEVTETGMANVNFVEYYYAIENATAFSHYKIVFEGTNMFQFSELWVYEK